MIEAAVRSGTRSGLVSWPMYDVDDRSVAAFWDRLREAMLAAGLSSVPDGLVRVGPLPAHWTDPRLLLSQTCGFPFATDLRGRVRYVCTPRFRADGCSGSLYSSAIVVRQDCPAWSLEDLRGLRAAYNSRDSQSGYNALRACIAPLARAGRFFSEVVESGSHRASLRSVRERRADVAAIDAVTLGLIGRTAPRELDGMRTLAFTQPTPGLPFITGLKTTAADLLRLRRACTVACDPASPAARGLLLDGVDVLDEACYEDLTTMQARAAELGYPELA